MDAPAAELQRALNALLPGDIACPALRGAADDFHPRYHALKRCYRYRVIAAPWPDPLRERYALRVWPAPDVEAMAEAARDLPGKRDFGAFGSAPREGSHTVRTVLRAEWLRKDGAPGILDRSGRFSVPHGAHDYGHPVAGGERAIKRRGIPRPAREPPPEGGRLRPHRLTDCA